MPMRFLVVLSATLMFYGLALLWPRFSNLPVLRTKPVPAGPRSTATEGFLVRRLMSGEITRRQYTLAMGELAAGAADRPRFKVLPEAAPPGP
jgi:hypothetical protein